MRPALLLLALLIVGCGESVTVPATGTIYGELVYSDGQPAPNVEVLVEGEDLSRFSDAEGKFVINDVLAVDETGMGRHYVIRGRGERGDVSVGFFIEHFKVKGQQSYSVGTVVVRPTGMISGVLLLDGATDHSGARIGIEGSSLETITRADGGYLLEAVPAYEGYVVTCRKGGHVDMDIDTMDVDGEEVPVRVEPGSMTELEESVLHWTS